MSLPRAALTRFQTVCSLSVIATGCTLAPLAASAQQDPAQPPAAGARGGGQGRRGQGGPGGAGGATTVGVRKPSSTRAHAAIAAS